MLHSLGKPQHPLEGILNATLYADIMFNGKNILAAMGVNKKDAEDLLHLAFTQLLEGKRLRGKSPEVIQKWVIRRAVWRLKDEQRKWCQLHIVEIKEANMENEPIDWYAFIDILGDERLAKNPEQILMEQEAYDDLLQEIPNERDREMVDAIIHGANRDEIASEYGIKRNTVDQIWRRCMKLLASILLGDD